MLNRRSLAWVMGVSGVLGAALLSACGGGGTSVTEASVPIASALSAQAALGEKIFADVSLSASGKQACASCHSAANAHAPANNLALQLGGALLDQQGRRMAPAINYLSTNTGFFFAADGTPTGGFFWDGRAASLLEQAGEPFVNTFEMANASVAEVVCALRKACRTSISTPRLAASSCAFAASIAA